MELMKEDNELLTEEYAGIEIDPKSPEKFIFNFEMDLSVFFGTDENEFKNSQEKWTRYL